MTFYDDSNIDELITRYLAREATQQEITELEQWVLSAKENKKRFQQKKQLWMLSGLDKTESVIDVDQEWEQISNKLFKSDTKVIPIQSNRRRILSIAASLAVLVAASVWFFSQRSTNSTSVDLTRLVSLEQLPDGSTVSLHHNSTIEFELNKQLERREVRLEGDAFFEVERDTVVPFIVFSNQVEISVLGTSFYVDGRTDRESTEVIVRSGTVAVRVDNEEIILTANESAIYDYNTGTLSKQTSFDSNYLGWKENVLKFDNASLDQIVQTLNHHFNTSITIENEAAQKCQVTATYNNKELMSILNILESTIDITVDRSGESFEISGPGCN